MKSLQLEKPHVIVTIGIKGSGKTFFAQKFADTFNAPFVEQAAFVSAAQTEELAESLMQRMLTEMLKTGRSIVLELSLATRIERTELANTIRKAGYVPLFVWVQVDTETAMGRSYRATKLSQSDYKESLRKFGQPHASEHVLVISGKHTFATQAKAVLKKLSAPRAAKPPVEDRKPQPQRGQIIVR